MSKNTKQIKKAFLFPSRKYYIKRLQRKSKRKCNHNTFFGSIVNIIYIVIIMQTLTVDVTKNCDITFGMKGREKWGVR